MELAIINGTYRDTTTAKNMAQGMFFLFNQVVSTPVQQQQQI